MTTPGVWYSDWFPLVRGDFFGELPDGISPGMRPGIGITFQWSGMSVECWWTGERWAVRRLTRYPVGD